jgi:riboflavin transporter FmnP
MLKYLITSAVLGTLAGTSAVFAFSFFIVAPIWGPQLYKGDERWETLFFIAATLLPFSALVGTVFTSIILRFSTFRLKHRGVIISCLAIMLFVWTNKPVVSRLRGPNFLTPRFEWMPDLMCAVTVGVLAVTLLSALLPLNHKRNAQSS